MYFIYSLFLYLLTPFILLRLWWKGRRLPAYKQRVLERFCLDTNLRQTVDIWVHAVSLGEVIAVTPLVSELLKAGHSVLITTMTPTGSERVMAQFGDKVVHRYLPYDLPLALNRFFNTYKPKVAVIMETELWPNLVRYAHKAKIPLLLANARLSERSLKGYMPFKFLFSRVLENFTAILAQSEEDAQRFCALGAPQDKVMVLGNVKFDLQINTIQTEQFKQLKKLWGANRVAVIAASTHENEESAVLSQLRKLQQAIPGVVLLIAPRHPERFQTIYQLAQQQGYNTGLRSQAHTLSMQNEVVVLDSLGELLGLYSISDYAFVGGSLVPVGGHNVLEPIAMKTPTLSGNQVHNFKAICHDLNTASAIVIVSSAAELIDEIIALHANNEAKTQMISRATTVLESNKGALNRHLLIIEKHLS